MLPDPAALVNMIVLVGLAGVGGAMLGLLLGRVGEPDPASPTEPDDLRTAPPDAPPTGADPVAVLTHERDLARREAQDRQRFLAAISHELRTPLHGIIGVVDLLTETELPDEDRPLVEAARDASRELHGLVDDILAYATTSVDVEDRVERVHGRVWIESLVAPARLAARDKGLALHVVVAGPLSGPVWLDAERVGRAVHHLVDNAVRYTHEGGVVVRLDLTDDEVILRVVDTGPGVPAQVMASEVAFASGGEGLRRRGREVGLGLGLVRALARRLGGRVEVRSSAEGTDAALHLPARRQGAEVRVG